MEKAEKYRNSFAHYAGPSTVSNSYTLQKSKEVELPEVQADGSVKMVKKKATVLSYGVGDYTYVEDIVNNILEFSDFTGKMIIKLLSDMTAD